MAPLKAKSLTTAAAVSNLVDEISTLKIEVTEMKDEIRGCHDVIREQQRMLTYQNECIQRILGIVSNQPVHPRLSLSQHLSLDESGPQGIIFTNEQQPPLVTMEPMPPTPASPVPQPARIAPALMSHRSCPPRVTPSALNDEKCSSDANGSIPTTILSPAKVPATPMKAQLKATQPREKRSMGLSAAAPRVASLHIFNLDINTTAEDVVRHVRTQMGISAPICEQLVVTRGSYSSFRLDVPTDKLRTARNIKNWPEGVSVRTFNVVQPKNLAAKRAATHLK